MDTHIGIYIYTYMYIHIKFKINICVMSYSLQRLFILSVGSSLAHVIFFLSCPRNKL